MTTLFNTIGYLNNFAEISFEPVVIGNSQSPTLPNGHYQFILPANYLMDSAGNGSPASTVNFFVLSGDANHDGIINAADYIAIDNGFNSGGPLKGFHNGDFNYDGVINGDDYTLIDNAFNTQVATPPAIVPSPTIETSAAIQPATIKSVFIPANVPSQTKPQDDFVTGQSIWSAYFDSSNGNLILDE